MNSVQGHTRFSREHSSATPSVAPLDSSPSPKSCDKFSDQPARPSGMKLPVANAPVAVTSIPKYSEDDLQRIFKTVLEARVSVLTHVLAPTPVLASVPTAAPAPALIVAEVLRKKMKAHSLDIFYGKSYIDCYNFC